MIIFIYGEDTYRSSQKLNEIKNKFVAEVDQSKMNLVTLDGANLKFEEFNQQVKASPFLARKRMIIIKNLISANKSKDIQKEVAELLEQKKDDNIIIFWESADRSKTKSKNALWDRLVKEKFAQEFPALKPYQINQWLEAELKKQNVKYEKQIIPLLAAKIGNDLWQMSNELEKLINFCKDKIITVIDVENMVKAKYDDNIFNLIDALSNKNKKLALKLIADQFSLESNEIYLLTMFIRQFRILLLIKGLQQKNPVVTKFDITKKLKIHPFVAQKSLAQAQNFELSQLKQIYQSLLHIDLKIKTSAVKPKLLFDLLIAGV